MENKISIFSYLKKLKVSIIKKKTRSPSFFKYYKTSNNYNNLTKIPNLDMYSFVYFFIKIT